MKINLKNLILFFLLAGFAPLSGDQIVTVDFLETLNQKVNGAGPILVKVDSERNRIILVNTYTSSVSLIDGENHQVENIPIRNRIPQYLKDAALALDKRTGNIYLIGVNSIHLIIPDKKTSHSIALERQYEMVAVDEHTGNAFLAGRESRDLAVLDFQKMKTKTIPCFDREESLVNLNATPPPSIRKVVCDSELRKVFVADGYTNTLFTFSAESGKLLFERPIILKKGSRWHFAGYNDQTHYLYAVIETDQRKVVQAAKINVLNGKDFIVDLPELTEGVGINYNPVLDEIYIPYDNHPLVHVVSFINNGEVSEIKIPGYGNDASAIDLERSRLYISSWAYGEIDVIDIKERKIRERIRDAGILPHMFSMDYNPSNGKLYVPIGGTAVNGSHGAAVTAFDVSSFQSTKIVTGWAPVDLIQIPGQSSFLVFNSEDEFAEVYPDGSFQIHTFPFPYPRTAVLSKNKTVYLSYGPHQSYWPVVYIWAAKNGIMEIEYKKIETSGNDSSNFQIYDRRIPRLAQQIATDSSGALWCLQNSWGKEMQFLSHFPSGIRQFSPQNRMELTEEIERETCPRILKYDKTVHRLYLVKLGEKDNVRGKMMIVDPVDQKIIFSAETGVTPTDLVFDRRWIYIANFDDNTITEIDKSNGETRTLHTGSKPFKMASGDGVYVINHGDNTLQRLGARSKTFRIPYKGKPDNLFYHHAGLILTSHTEDALKIIRFSTESESFELVYEMNYPFGETSMDTNNSSFYTRGQFGDSIFEITRIKSDNQGRLWITDFLSGKLFIIHPDEE